MRRNVVLGKVKQNKGFTLMETLIVVGIMTVLTAVSFLAVGDAKKNMEMTEVDDCARSIYLQAQSKLSVIEVEGGMPEFYNELTTNYSDRFLSSAPQDYVAADEEWEKICYITKEDEVTKQLISTNTNAYQMDGDYILEVNAQTGDVYSVFYWGAEEDINYSEQIAALTDRTRSAREAEKLGYYGGGVSMTTVALLENAPAGDEVHMGGEGGDRGGFIYYEQYADGTYGVLVIGDDKNKTYTKGYNYEQALASYTMDNTLRDEECVNYGFAMFNGMTGYWRYAENMYNPGASGAIQDWPLISESEEFEKMPNIMPDSDLQNEYTLYKIYENPGPLEEPQTEGYWGWNGEGRGYYIMYLIAYCDEPNGWYQQLKELTEFFNIFLEKRYDELSAA